MNSDEVNVADDQDILGVVDERRQDDERHNPDVPGISQNSIQNWTL